jgi:hypothetical protein
MRLHDADTASDMSVKEHRARQSVLRLQGRRALAYAEYGDSAGSPILEFHGLPNPRQADTVPHGFLRDRGIRRITVDRPGMGFSDPQPGRTLLDWPHDVAELVDALGLRRFVVLGCPAERLTPWPAPGRFPTGSRPWPW